MGKTYEYLVPYGILRVQDIAYWMLMPYPISSDNWYTSQQQAWSVVPFNPMGFEIDVPLYGYARTIVCSNPLIEYRECETIKVLQLETKVEDEPYIEVDVSDEPADIVEGQRRLLEDIDAIPPEEDHSADAFERWTEESAERYKHALEMWQEGLI